MTFSGYNILSGQVTVERSDSIVKLFKLVNVEIESSFEYLSSTAVITLPYDNRYIGRSINSYNQNSINGQQFDYFQPGNKVSVKLGYDHQNHLIFCGKITAIDSRYPLKLYCDSAVDLKKHRIIYSKTGKVTLEEFLPTLLQGTGLKVHEKTLSQQIVFDGLSVRNKTAAQVLDDWRGMGLVSYLRLNRETEENELVVGRSYFSNSSTGVFFSGKEYKPPVLRTGYNVISDDLKLDEITGNSIALKAVSMLKGNKRLEMTFVQHPQSLTDLVLLEEQDFRKKQEARDRINRKLNEQNARNGIFPENYTIKTVHFFNLDKDALTDAATGVFPKQIVSGLSGRLVTFGDWPIMAADSIIFDSLEDEGRRSGEYIVRQLNITFGNGGYRYELEIPHKVRDI